MIKLYRKGLVGIASWDMGQNNSNGCSYSSLDPDFYKKHLEYILKQYKHRSVAAEWQIESFFHQSGNHTWQEFPDTKLYKIDNFQYFLIKNLFWSLHLRAFGCDISSVHQGHRNWAVKEHLSGIDFAFRMGMNAITFHPGSYNERVNDDPYINFTASWDEAVRTHGLRQKALTGSIREIIRHYVSKIETHENDMEQYARANQPLIRQLMQISSSLQKGRTDRLKEVDNVEKITLISEAFELLKRCKVPVKIFRRILLPDCATHLCIENIEPYNFLMNLPGQMEYWFELISEVYYRECADQAVSTEFRNNYRPMTIVDCNHFINSQYILRKNPQIHGLFGSSYEDCFLEFCALPGYYTAGEPLLNRMIRKNRDNILYWHLSGLYDTSEYLLTHEPIKPFRERLETQTVNNELTFTYQLGNHHSGQESDLETIIQVIGMNEIYILEIFDTSSENVKNSWENVSSFLKYLHSLKSYATEKLLGHHPELELSGCQFAEVPIGRGHCGIKEFIYYKYTNSYPYFQIIARFSDRGKINSNIHFQG